jgi:hypothetical protein
MNIDRFWDRIGRENRKVILAYLHRARLEFEMSGSGGINYAEFLSALEADHSALDGDTRALIELAKSPMQLAAVSDGELELEAVKVDLDTTVKLLAEWSRLQGLASWFRFSTVDKMTRAFLENVGQRMKRAKPRWRTGTKNPHTLYVDEKPAGFIQDPENAKLLVEATNLFEARR